MKNKNIILGISGGIAAYKSAGLVRELKKAGANVRVIMTKGAKAFITPLTMQALSGEEVKDSLIDASSELGMGHIELARWADAIIIAPASANLISELACGSAAQLLTTVCLATSSPIFICPAMNMHMWSNPAVQKNMTLINELGMTCIGPESGEQACGDIGFGRMSEVNNILNFLLEHFNQSLLLKGKKVLITLGPTREYLDPVRYITNESSGLMGHSLAVAAYQAGAKVTVVAGPTQLTFPKGVSVFPVISAADMFDRVETTIKDSDIFISTAAVSDYRPDSFSLVKIKKQTNELMLPLIKNKDILSHIGTNKLCPFVVGFAAETTDVEKYAKEKLINKNLDLIIANHVGSKGTGFNSVYNTATVYGAKGQKVAFDKMEKTVLAKLLIELIAKEIGSKPL